MLLPKLKWTIYKTLIFFKIFSLALSRIIPLSILFVEAPFKQLFLSDYSCADFLMPFTSSDFTGAIYFQLCKQQKKSWIKLGDLARKILRLHNSVFRKKQFSSQSIEIDFIFFSNWYWLIEMLSGRLDSNLGAYTSSI